MDGWWISASNKQLSTVQQQQVCSSVCLAPTLPSDVAWCGLAYPVDLAPLKNWIRKDKYTGAARTSKTRVEAECRVQKLDSAILQE